jgi:predicted component of type VI protein secretion system
VLRAPKSNERELIDKAIDKAQDMMPDWLAGNFEKAMRELHQKLPSEKIRTPPTVFNCHAPSTKKVKYKQLRKKVLTKHSVNLNKMAHALTAQRILA